MSLNKLEFRMAIPVVTREYTRGSCSTSSKPKRLPPFREIRLNSQALGAEPFRVPNQTIKEL